MDERPKQTFLIVEQTGPDGQARELWRTPSVGYAISEADRENGDHVLVLQPAAPQVAEEAPSGVVGVEYSEKDDGWYFWVVDSQGDTSDMSKRYVRKDSMRKAAERLADELGVEAREV